MGFLDNSRGDDPQDEDFLIFAEFALISHGRRPGLTLDLNTPSPPTGNEARGSLAIDLYPDRFFEPEGENYGTVVVSLGFYAEDGSDISESAADNSPEQHLSASAEDSEPQRPPAPARRRKRKRKHKEQQRGAEEAGGGPRPGPWTRSRAGVPTSPHSSTDCLKDRKGSKKRPKSPSQHTSKDGHANTSKKRSKRVKKRGSQKGRRADEDKETANRVMKVLRCRIFPTSGSNQCVVKKANEGRETEEKKKIKIKRKHTKLSGGQEGRGAEEPVTATYSKRKDGTKSNVRPSGSKGEDSPPEPPKKKKYEWITNLFRGRTKGGGESLPDPASTRNKKENLV